MRNFLKVLTITLACTAAATYFSAPAKTSYVIPKDVVAFFAAASCPSGWAEYTSLQGRYPVGLVSAGTLEGTSGTALTNAEARAVGQHNHTGSQAAHSHTITVTDGGHVHGIARASNAGGGNLLEGTNGPGAYTQNSASATTGITASSNAQTPAVTVDNTGAVAGTNAPYIQLLACKKF